MSYHPIMRITSFESNSRTETFEDKYPSSWLGSENFGSMLLRWAIISAHGTNAFCFSSFRINVVIPVYLLFVSPSLVFMIKDDSVEGSFWSDSTFDALNTSCAHASRPFLNLLKALLMLGHAALRAAVSAARKSSSRQRPPAKSWQYLTLVASVNFWNDCDFLPRFWDDDGSLMLGAYEWL